MRNVPFGEAAVVDESIAHVLPMTSANAHPGGGPALPVCFLSPDREEALYRMWFLLENRLPTGWLCGLPRTGKSTVLGQFARILRSSAELRSQFDCVAEISLLGMSCEELLPALLEAVGVSVPETAGSVTHWRSWNSYRQQLDLQKRRLVLCIDQLDDAEPNLVPALQRIVESARSSQGAITVLLAGRTDTLNGKLLEIFQSVDLVMPLEPWAPATLPLFLTACAADGGGSSLPCELAAYHHLHELTHGIPGEVVRMVRLCLVGLQGGPSQEFDRALLDAAAQSLHAA